MAVERGTDAANISRGADGSGTGNPPYVPAAGWRRVARRPRVAAPPRGGTRAGARGLGREGSGRRASAGRPPGCHWTPSAQRRSGSSIASTRSSSTLQPARHDALAERGRPPGDGGTWSRAGPRRTPRAASEPGARRTSWSALSKEPSARRWSVWPTSSGRCWTSVPPRATFISCMPRQMPSTGQVALERAQRQGDLGAVAVGAGVGGLRDGARRRRRRGRCPRRRPAPGRRGRRARRPGGRRPTRPAGASARSRPPTCSAST